MDKKTALLSICIPTFNRKEYLRSMLSNLSGQLLELDDPASVEIVVSDNASVDGTYEFLKELKEPAGIVINKNNTNLGPALNLHTVMKMSTGRYCWLMGDDDYIVPGALKKIVAIISKNPGVGLFYVNYSQKNDAKPIIRLKTDLMFKTGAEYIDYGLSNFNVAEWDPAKFTFYPSMIVDRKSWFSAGDNPCLVMPQAYIVHSFLPKVPVYMISETLFVQNTDNILRPSYRYYWAKMYWFMGGVYGHRFKFSMIILHTYLGDFKYRSMNALKRWVARKPEQSA